MNFEGRLYYINIEIEFMVGRLRDFVAADSYLSTALPSVYLWIFWLSLTYRRSRYQKQIQTTICSQTISYVMQIGLLSATHASLSHVRLQNCLSSPLMSSTCSCECKIQFNVWGDTVVQQLVLHCLFCI